MSILRQSEPQLWARNADAGRRQWPAIDAVIGVSRTPARCKKPGSGGRSRGKFGRGFFLARASGGMKDCGPSLGRQAKEKKVRRADSRQRPRPLSSSLAAVARSRTAGDGVEVDANVPAFPGRVSSVQAPSPRWYSEDSGAKKPPSGRDRRTKGPERLRGTFEGFVPCRRGAWEERFMQAFSWRRPVFGPVAFSLRGTVAC